jgi:hypothetical protein
MTIDINEVVKVIIVAFSFFLLGQYVQKSNTENISDQQYKQASLQYMEDTRNAIDYIASQQ